MSIFDQLVFRRRKPLIVHAHMFKNAGSSLDWALAKSFGEAFLDHRDDKNMKRGAEYLGFFLAENPNLQALSSHWVTYPLPSIKGIRLWPILMFRHPIERVRSVYQFERKQEPANTPGSIKAKALCFKDYVAWQMEPMPGPVIKNYQTRYCSGNYLGGDIEVQYGKAVEHINGTPLLGVVDRYDESMVLFEHGLKKSFPIIDLSYIQQNVTQKNYLTIQQRIESILEELGDIADVVLDNNRYDLLLYQTVSKHVEARLSAIKGLDEKLSDFRNRCQHRHQ